MFWVTIDKSQHSAIIVIQNVTININKYEKSNECFFARNNA